MTTYSFATTRLVNQSGTEPVVTEEQLWKGLEFKARNPTARFRPDDLFEQGCKKLVRELTVGTTVIREEIEVNEATIVYFEMDTGLRVMNVISYGPNDELLLTYSFANGIPGVPADKPKPSAKELNANIGKSVERGIAIIRQMAKEGKL
ncbi:hypothetical protein B0H10DRAFT_2303130 [Mycena sp. CBHHK59/15]|nr:hypothetical protein B0H10DRAFT_2303130 [Mycena sp. CBHHK59/15]